VVAQAYSSFRRVDASADPCKADGCVASPHRAQLGEASCSKLSKLAARIAIQHRDPLRILVRKVGAMPSLGDREGCVHLLGREARAASLGGSLP
jgi:hypothetical protein